MCLGYLGLLISERASIKALSWSGMSVMWRSIIVLATGFPRLSQLAGMSFQVCLTYISSQCMVAVRELVSNTVIMEDSTNSDCHR